MNPPDSLSLPRAAAKRHPAPALSTRLMVAITAAAFATLALAVAYLDRAMKVGLIFAHEEGLGDHLKVLQKAIDDDPVELHAPRMVLENTLGSDKSDKSYGCLTSADGRILLETPGFTAFSPPLSSFPPPLPPGNPENVKITLFRHAGQPVILTSALLNHPGAGGILTYYYAEDAMPVQDFIAGRRRELGLVLVAGTLLSAGLAWIIARRGMRPVERITETISRTTAKALEQPEMEDCSPPDNSGLPREIAKLADAFAALRSRLGRSFHQLRQFSDDAAHEIRTPLNNMMGIASLTLQRDRSPEEYRAALVSTLEECDRLKKLADGLLFISRADHHRSVISTTAFSAGSTMAEVADYHSGLAADQDVEIRIEGDGQLQADRSLFRQAMTNVLSNALRHTPPGGRITVTFAAAPGPGGSAVLTVSDTGEGIEPAHLPHIFDRFYRVDAARTHQTDAPAQTGLGLAIVKAIMELHGGTVTAASTPGQGTTLTLTWPWQEAASGPA